MYLTCRGLNQNFRHWINKIQKVKIIETRLNYSFSPSICHEISVWSLSFSLSQFGSHFLKNDSI